MSDVASLRLISLSFTQIAIEDIKQASWIANNQINKNVRSIHATLKHLLKGIAKPPTPYA